MNSHLTSEEIYQWLSGERGDEVEEHFRECPACHAEMYRLRNALAGFRHSLEQTAIPAVSYPRIRHALPRWILATPVYWSARQQRAAEQAKTDELLLERVHAGLSRTVPASMEPLMQLVSREEK
jgi:anti-sigma factor RsiW